MYRSFSNMRMQFQKRRRGGILLAVLGLVYLMSIMVSQFLETTINQLRLQAAQTARHELRVLGYSALEVTFAVINEFSIIDEGIYGRTQGWGDPIGYAKDLEWPEGVEITVTITDESGKIPLANPNIEQLKMLFEEMDISFSDQDVLVDSLIDWQDEDDLERLNGGEESYYQRQTPALKPANAPITSFETLRYIRGFSDLFFDEDTGTPNGNFDAFTNATSLYSQNAINMNSISEELKEALSNSLGFDSQALDDYIMGDDRELGTADDRALRSNEDLELAGVNLSGDAAIGFEVSILKVNIKVTHGDKHFSINTLAELSSGSGGGNQGQDGEGQSSNNTDGGESNSEQDPNNRSRNSNRSNNQANSNGAGSGGSGGDVDYPISILRLVENSNVD